MVAQKLISLLFLIQYCTMCLENSFWRQLSESLQFNFQFVDHLVIPEDVLKMAHRQHMIKSLHLQFMKKEPRKYCLLRYFFLLLLMFYAGGSVLRLARTSSPFYSPLVKQSSDECKISANLFNYVAVLTYLLHFQHINLPHGLQFLPKQAEI